MPVRREPERGSRRREEDIGERWPDLPEWATADELDPEVRRDLRGLSKEGADWVAAHLVAAGSLADEEPELAWRHARAARARGGRIGVVRETVGLVAYRAGEWAEAIGELRAARRMGGGPGHLAVMADCERALGHPERAIEISRSTEANSLEPEAAIELQIVVAGARADLGQVDAALAQIQRLGLDTAEGHARLAYAYADLLLKAGRRDEAVGWFIRSANADLEEETDALERLDELGAEEGDELVLAPSAKADDEHTAAPAAEVNGDPGAVSVAGVDDELGAVSVAQVDDELSAVSVAQVDDANQAPDASPDDDPGLTVDTDENPQVVSAGTDRHQDATPEPFDDAPAETPAFTNVETSAAEQVNPERPHTAPEAASPALSAPIPAGPPATDLPAPGDGDGNPAEPTSADDTEPTPAIVPTILFSDDLQTGDR